MAEKKTSAASANKENTASQSQQNTEQSQQNTEQPQQDASTPEQSASHPQQAAFAGLTDLWPAAFKDVFARSYSQQTQAYDAFTAQTAEWDRQRQLGVERLFAESERVMQETARLAAEAFTYQRKLGETYQAHVRTWQRESIG